MHVESTASTYSRHGDQDVFLAILTSQVKSFQSLLAFSQFDFGYLMHIITATRVHFFHISKQIHYLLWNRLSVRRASSCSIRYSSVFQCLHIFSSWFMSAILKSIVILLHETSIMLLHFNIGRYISETCINNSNLWANFFHTKPNKISPAVSLRFIPPQGPKSAGTWM